MKKFLAPRKGMPVNLTPLLDVMFVIIIFFSLGTEIKRSGGVNIDLPESRTNDSVSRAAKSLSVSIDEKGSIFIGKRNVTIPEFGELLRSGEYAPEKPVILEADKLAAHGDVIRVIDELRANGFRRLNFAARLVQ